MPSPTTHAQNGVFFRSSRQSQWFPQVIAKISYLKGFYRGHSIPAEVREEFSADGTRKSNQEAFLSYFQNFRMGQEYFESRAHELHKPVLVVWGKYGRFISSKLVVEQPRIDVSINPWLFDHRV